MDKFEEMEAEAQKAAWGTDTVAPEVPICAGCGEPIDIGEPAYAVQSGYIEQDGIFVRTDCVSQYFHIGKCLNSED